MTYTVVQLDLLELHTIIPKLRNGDKMWIKGQLNKFRGLRQKL